MKTSAVEYLGNLRTEAVHLRSGSKLVTDAPVDNQGKGEAFSPTDLLATSLAQCILTTMAIVAARHNIIMNGASATVTKIMADNPRRVAEVIVEITMDKSYTDNDRILLERTAHQCPVARSLHPDVKQTITFIYK